MTEKTGEQEEDGRGQEDNERHELRLGSAQGEEEDNKRDRQDREKVGTEADGEEDAKKKRGG